MSDPFPTLSLTEYQDTTSLELQSLSGKAIYIIKYGMELGDIREGDIYRSPWGKLLFVSSIILYNDISIVTPYFYLLSSSCKEDIRKNYGTFDIIEFMPVCGLAYFKPTPRRLLSEPLLDRYYKGGIIYNDMVYECNGLDDVSVTSLFDRATEFSNAKTIYVPTTVVVEQLERQMNQGPSIVEFMSRVIGLSNRKGSEDDITGSGNFHFKNLTKLYYFLRGRRSDNV